MRQFVAYLSKLKIGLHIVWALLLLIQVTNFFDPFRGWLMGTPHYIAATLSVLAYSVARILLRFVPMYQVRSWQVIVAFVLLVFLFFLSLNIAIELRPGQWFLKADMTEVRLHLTLLSYSLFSINLAVLVALLNRLKPRDRRARSVPTKCSVSRNSPE